MGILFGITFVVNFIGLIITLWLGIYIVTRNARHLVAWLSAITLWCVAGLFLNILLAIDPPPLVQTWPDWLRFLLPFWPYEAFYGMSNAWLQGWTIVAAVAVWHHATVLMRPGELNAVRKVRILAGYAIAIFGIVIQETGEGIISISPGSNPLFLSSIQPGPWFLFSVFVLILLVIFIVNDLAHAAASTTIPISRKQLVVIVSTTATVGFVAPLIVGGMVLHIPLPIAILSVLILALVGVVGFGVARYSIFMAGRTIWRDFTYHLLLLCVVVVVYLLLCWVLIEAYQAPPIIVVFIPGLAVITHSLLNSAYRLFDPLFYRSSTRQLRLSMQQLLRLSGVGKTFEDNLADTLKTLCAAVDASYGLIAIFDQGTVRKIASYRWRTKKDDLKPADLSADDVEYLTPGQLKRPLEEAALLIPLYAESDQLGALVLGSPTNGMQYEPEDVDDLLDRSDKIADMIYIAQLKTNYMKQMVEMAESQHHLSGKKVVTIPINVVESALRNLYDFSFLADSPLANLEIVRSHLPGECTHLERGKIVHNILLAALEKLCPQKNVPRDPPPREWHPYIILREAYEEEKPNRDIMSRLYISEGTFNRTRRSAIRSVARALGEMEMASS